MFSGGSKENSGEKRVNYFCKKKKLHQAPLLPIFTCSKSTKEILEKCCEIYVKLPIKTPERCQLRHSDAFIVNSENTSHLFLVFLLLTLNK